MMKSDNVTWDLYLDGEIQAASEAHKAVNEDLKELCKRQGSFRTGEAGYGAWLHQRSSL